MPLLNLTMIRSVWKTCQRIVEFSQIYCKFIRFILLIILILFTFLFQPFRPNEMFNYENKTIKALPSLFSLNSSSVILGILVAVVTKQMMSSTSFQKTLISYVILLNCFEILSVYYLYQYLHTDLYKFSSVSISGFNLYSILIVLKFSNQIIIYVPERFSYLHRIYQKRTFIEYFLQVLLLWKIGYTRYDFFIILNRILTTTLYSDLYKLLSNEDIWKNLICFMRLNQNDNIRTYRITKDQLFLLFPSISIAYEILTIRSIINYSIFCNMYQLMKFSIGNSNSTHTYIQLFWFLMIFLVIIDSCLLFFHTDKFGVFWFFTGLTQWNVRMEIDINLDQSSYLYSIYLKVTCFMDEYCSRIFRNIFALPRFHHNDNENISQVNPVINVAEQNQNNGEHDEERHAPREVREVLDLYEYNGKTPSIHLIGDNRTIQPTDILVGFVGLSGRGKSHLLRCITRNDIFKSGNRPTTYKAVGTLCIYNNHRYWMIDAPGDSQATEPEKKYYYKKWIDPSFNLPMSHLLQDENGHKYEEARLTTDVVTQYNKDLKQKLNLIVFVFDNRIDQLLKDYYNDQIIRHLGMQSRVIFARTKWDIMHVKTVDARNKNEKDERQLLTETFGLNSNRLRIVFTTGLIDDEPDNDPEIMRSIRQKGFTIENLKQMIDETTNEHWEKLQEEKKAFEEGSTLRLSELKQGDHILYFPTNKTKAPYSLLIASNQDDGIQVFARTARFTNNVRQKNSCGTEYHKFSFENFRRSTFNQVGKAVPDDYASDPPLMIPQLYKNSTQTEKKRTFAIEKRFPELKTPICNIKSDGPSKSLPRAALVIQNTGGIDTVTFDVHSSSDFVYTCKTGQQSPGNFWTTYELSSVSYFTCYGGRALSYFGHVSFAGATKSLCRVVGRYPVFDVVIGGINCYQDPQNKTHHIAKAAAGGIVSTVVCIAASSMTGPLAPLVLYGGMVAGPEIANYIIGKIVKRKAPRNKRAIMISEDNDD